MLDSVLPPILLDAVRDAVIYTDVDHRILYWNAAASDVYGYTAAEMLGRTPAALYPDVSAVRQASDQEEIAPGVDTTGVRRARRKDGSEAWVEVETTAVSNELGRPIGFVAISRNISDRLARETAARTSEGRFRALAETASDGIVAIDTASTILFANAGVGRIFGYPADELLGTDLTRLMPDYLHQLHRAGMARYVETGVRHIHWAATELPGKHRDGRSIPLEISFGESRDDGRQVFTGIIRDITSRKRLERRLTVESTVAQVLGRATSEAGVLVDILEAVGAALGWPWGAIWVRDTAGQVMCCSQIWSADPKLHAGFAERSRRLELAVGEGLPGRVWATGAPAWVSAVLGDLDFVRATEAREVGLHCGVAFPVTRRGETHAVIEFLADQAEEPDVELLGLMTTVGAQVGEFMERHRAEMALERSEVRYRLLVEATSQLVWTSDPAGDIVEELPSWTAYTGQSLQEYRGRGWIDAVHPDDRDAVLAAWRVAVAAREPLREIEARIRRADAEYGTFALRGVPIFGPGGEVREWVATCTDVSVRKRSEGRLRQADRMDAVGRLAGGVAHEANNQMTVVLGSAEFVLRREDLPEVVRQDVELIRMAAERTAAITAQLLAFSRRQVLKPRPVDLDDEVRSLEPILRRTLGECCTLALHPGSLVGKVRADPGQLAQVLLNLTFNARDAMPDGGTLTIRTRAVELTTDQAAAHPDEPVVPGPYAVLVVSDTGHGMDRATLARIFEPFFTTKPVGQGTGLGLASVHGIVRQSGGHVWASSEPGAGATFEIYLPMTPSEAGGGPPPAPEPEVRGKGTVLVAEDDPPLRGIIARILRESGYEVLEAEDGEQALEIVRSRPGLLALVVADLIMPRMNGRELATRLERERPGTRVLFISGFPDRDVIERGLLEGGRPFLQKPFAPEALTRIVKELTMPDGDGA
ncbi:MAG: PAS domain S-box protein [Gemmatimonadota bacterium]|nr:PAS domain S-box protein [Gemmatimonadota bacterium]